MFLLREGPPSGGWSAPDGKILAVAGSSFPPDEPKEPGGATNRLAFWEVGTWKKLDFLPGAGAGATEWAAAATVAFSNDGRLLAVGSRDGWVRLWDLQQKRLVKEFKELENYAWGVTVTFSSNNRWLASFSKGYPPSIVLFDLADPGHPLPVPLSRNEQGGVLWAVFAPDNKSLITASRTGLIKFWNLQTRHVALTLRHGHAPGGALGLAPDGSFLVSKDATGLVKIWHAPSLEEIDRKRKSR